MSRAGVGPHHLHNSGTPLAAITEEFSGWRQDDFIQRVKLFSDRFDLGHPGYGLPGDFICDLAGHASEWVQWSAEEKVAWAEDFAPSQEQEIESWWLPKPWSEPVIAVEGTDGLFYAWDK
jgi:hypothetical protein